MCGREELQVLPDVLVPVYLFLWLLCLHGHYFNMGICVETLDLEDKREVRSHIILGFMVKFGYLIKNWYNHIELIRNGETSYERLNDQQAFSLSDWLFLIYP